MKEQSAWLEVKLPRCSRTSKKHDGRHWHEGMETKRVADTSQRNETWGPLGGRPVRDQLYISL